MADLTEPTEPTLKLVCVGDGGVGKTCMLVVFRTDEFPEKYIPTIFDNYNHSMEVDKEIVSLALWDTAGQEDYARIRPLSYIDCDILLISFSIDNRDSYNNVITKWKPETQRYARKSPVILVGTKIDLRNEDGTHISKADGEKLAKEINATKYLECSASTKEGLNELFEEAVRVARSAKGKTVPTKKPVCNLI